MLADTGRLHSVAPPASSTQANTPAQPASRMTVLLRRALTGLSWRGFGALACAIAVGLLGIREIIELRSYSDLAASDVAGSDTVDGFAKALPPGANLSDVVIVLGFAAFVGISRWYPAWSFAGVWAVAILQIATRTELLLAELAVCIIAFNIARHGSRMLLRVSALAFPVLGVIGLLQYTQVYYLDSARGPFLSLFQYALGFSFSGESGAVVLVAALVIGIPWLLGIALRYADVSRASQASLAVAEAEAAKAIEERKRAEELSAARDQQAQLARDVHDVVGHSLAVILAQAQSAQYLESADALRRTMNVISDSARLSLQDVRKVLEPASPNPGGSGGRRPTGRNTTHDAPERQELRSLVERVHTSGRSVRLDETGMSRPMPPDLELVAFRVLQEMLTNAIKYGDQDAEIVVALRWDTALEIEVRNKPGTAPLTAECAAACAAAVGAGAAAAARPGTQDAVPDASDHLTAADHEHGGGRGIIGMRQRLERVGGHLVIDAIGLDGRFGVTATVPLRVAQ
ncbi:sensor histidine kinase [Plantibacter sp. YIM 135249]|uniref:sensor histidine kinase n=1 Tax=Plantibacter sp. YIM 135249 TaxID=3423918 RepID=UPI003D32B84A